tara:strand:- start:2821 stop:3534 length:714 start_codon:yes stop_codon:yes gene_type:complete
MPYYSAWHGTSTAYPGGLAQPNVWFRADSLSQANASDVTLWEDEGSNGYDADDSARSTPPTYIESDPTLEFMPCVNWLSGDELDVATMTAYVDFTWFIVFKQTGGNDAYEKLIDSDGAATACFRSGTSTSVWGGGAFQASPYLTSDTFTDGTWWIMTFQRSGTSQSVAANGNSLTTKTSQPTTAVTTGQWTIGHRHNASPVQNFEGRMAEIIMYDTALGTTDRESVRDYLNNKYGIY